MVPVKDLLSSSRRDCLEANTQAWGFSSGRFREGRVHVANRLRMPNIDMRGKRSKHGTGKEVLGRRWYRYCAGTQLISDRFDDRR